MRFVPELSGEYDLLIATDAFEHVPDLISVAASTVRNLRIGGRHLIANYYSPVIDCHLPQLFSLLSAWDQAICAMDFCRSRRFNTAAPTGALETLT